MQLRVREHLPDVMGNVNLQRRSKLSYRKSPSTEDGQQDDKRKFRKRGNEVPSVHRINIA